MIKARIEWVNNLDDQKVSLVQIILSIKEPATSPNTTKNIIGNQSCVNAIKLFIKKIKKI